MRSLVTRKIELPLVTKLPLTILVGVGVGVKLGVADKVSSSEMMVIAVEGGVEVASAGATVGVAAVPQAASTNAAKTKILAIVLFKGVSLRRLCFCRTGKFGRTKCLDNQVLCTSHNLGREASRLLKCY